MSMEVATIDQSLPLRASDVRAQVNLIQEVMRDVMKVDTHFGKVPGCGDKPTLLQPGAHKLLMTFHLVPDPDMQVIAMSGGHREVRCKVKLYIRGGMFVGAGVGTCSTMEGKFRFRTGPVEFTGKPVPKAYWDIRNTDPEKAKEMLGEGFVAKKNEAGAWVCARQGEKIEHDNPADYYNTVEKMAYKRALVSATLTVTAASDIFTQDIEDMPEVFTPPSPGAAQTAVPQETKPDKGAAVLDKMKKKGASKTVEGSAPPITGDDWRKAPLIIDDPDWDAFLDYAGDDPDRFNVITQLKEALAIGMVYDLQGEARVSFVREFQQSCKETGVPCEEWVKP